MGKAGCAIFGCAPDKRDGRHRFVNPQKNANLFQKWLRSTGNKQFLNLSYEYIYEKYRVCSKHFTEEDFGPNRILKENVYPKLFLPRPLLPVSDNTSSGETSEPIKTSCVESVSQPPSGESGSVYIEGQSEIEMESDTLQTISPCQGGSSSTEILEGTTSFATIQKRSYQGQRHLLQSMSIRRVTELTPRKRVLYESVKRYKRRYAAMKKKKSDFRRRLQEAKEFAEKDEFEKLTKDLSSISKRFFKSQIMCSKKKSKGRRFSIEDKLTALALYKKSGAAYSLLSKIFFLPSRVTLIKLLKKIPIKAGLCESVFHGLKEVCKNLTPLDKYCFVIFDEMALSQHLHYDQHTDMAVGFEDFGDRRTNKIADHVQVFMLRGIHRKWKQPVLYQFVQGAVKAPHIMKSIREVVRAAKSAGFRVLGTICDQGSNNVSAIEKLVEQTRRNHLQNEQELKHYVFEVDGDTLIPLFDPPHLLKGVRNNLLAKDIHFEMGGIKKTAKWKDIHNAWLLDCGSGHLRVMPKLTEYHVNPNKIKKMKVAACAQVFSHRVSSAINLMAKSGYSANDMKMEPRAVETAEFLKFMDTLFDSVNGSAVRNTEGKDLKCQVNVLHTETAHTKFWKEAIKIFQTMYCVTANGKEVTPPTFRNWQLTVRNLLLLKKVLKGFGFKAFKPRLLNQDPLENFFGQIRQRGSRFVNPNCTAFGQYYKSLLVNNLISKHSVGANCEDDNSKILLPLQNFISQENSEAVEEILVNDTVPISKDFPMLKKLEANAVAYVGGYIVKVKKLLSSCQICRYNVLSRGKEESSFLKLIQEREHGGSKAQRLQYINGKLFESLVKMYNIIRFVLKYHPDRKNLSATVKSCITSNVHLEFVSCDHTKDLIDKIIASFSKLIIHNYFNGANNVLTGRDQRPLPENCSFLYKEAKSCFLKKRGNRN